jgi:hypothetical protein
MNGEPLNIDAYFGPQPLAGRRVPTPLGTPCVACRSKIAAEDSGTFMPVKRPDGVMYWDPIHEACFERQPTL